MKILLVEDEKISRITLTDILSAEGFTVLSAPDGTEGMRMILEETFDTLITDLMLPGVNGMDLLRVAKKNNPHLNIIVMTAYGTVETAVEALKLGAFDYLTKPFDPERLIAILHHLGRLTDVLGENEKLRQRLELMENKTLVGNSGPIKKLLDTIRMIAVTDSTVLIRGESGTGKEVCARTIHAQSKRASGPFLAVNCAVIPETLLESEMFGHEKGAFTGAGKRHQGYFERANNGTLFIDDIDDMPISMQVKLLRVLQEREITRVGGSEMITIDVRIICATKVSLMDLVQQKLFREDLFYRLNIIPLFIPPLRERLEDIPLLIEHFLLKRNALDKYFLFSAETQEKFARHQWNGNIRELENAVERIIVTAGQILPDAPPDFLIPPPDTGIKKSGQDVSYPTFDEFISQKEIEIIQWALRESGNNLTGAAKLLGIPRTTLRSKMDKLFRE